MIRPNPATPESHLVHLVLCGQCLYDCLPAGLEDRHEGHTAAVNLGGLVIGRYTDAESARTLAALHTLERAHEPWVSVVR